MKPTKTVCVIGLWHLGIVNAVGFAEIGFNVVGLESDQSKLKLLKNGQPPIFEPGLEEALKRNIAKKTLTFTTDPEIVNVVDWVMIAFDSPVNEKDEVDISPITQAVEQIAPHLAANTPLIITSQIPLGTAEVIEQTIKQRNRQWKSGVVYVPENLKLGQAIERWHKPDMIILGASSSKALASAQTLYRSIKSPKLTMNLRSAEMVKHALNTFLATSITFINEIANLSDRLGADAVVVGQALKLDARIGQRALLMPGLGFSGGTLARDVTQLRKFAKGLQYTPSLLNAIVAINEGTFDEVIIKLSDRLGDLKGKKIGILGLTYKPGTSTVRQSPALKIISKLQQVKAECLAYDPMASDVELKQCVKITRVKKIANLAICDALVLITEWPEFRDFDYESLSKKMTRPIFIDTKNYLDPTKMTASGFSYQGYGRGLNREIIK